MRYLTFGLIFFLTSCGRSGGGGSTQDTSPTPPSGGTYSFITSPVLFTCSDKSAGTNPKIAMNVLVAVSLNTIKIRSMPGDNASESQATAAGLTIKSSGYSGLIQSNVSFIASQTGSGTYSNFGNFTVNYNIDGKFSGKNWNGTYTYTIVFISRSASCTYTSTFSGSLQ